MERTARESRPFFHALFFAARNFKKLKILIFRAARCKNKFRIREHDFTYTTTWHHYMESTHVLFPLVSPRWRRLRHFLILQNRNVYTALGQGEAGL